MTTRRLGTLDITGFGTQGPSPSVAVPPPAAQQPPPAAQQPPKAGTTSPPARQTLFPDTGGQPVMGPNVGTNGAVYSGGPGTSVQDFVKNFVFPNAQPGTAQDAFNQIKAKFGYNAAFSYALSNWNHFSGWDPKTGLYGAMHAAGVSSPDQGKLINTYSSSMKANYLGEGFGHESGGLFGQPGYNVFARSIFDPYSAAAQQAIQTQQEAHQTQMANGGYDYTNRTMPADPQFSTAAGVNPNGDAAAYIKYSTGTGTTQPPAVPAPGVIQKPAGELFGAAPSVAVPDPGWANISANQQRPTSPPTTVNPFGDLSGYRYLS